MALQSTRHFANEQTLMETMKRCKHIFGSLGLQPQRAGIDVIMHSFKRRLRTVRTGELCIGPKVLLVKLLKDRDDVFINRA